LIADRRGFTLVELLVVLAIMTLLFMIAAPHLGTVLPQMELKSGAREVAAALREARSRAIASNSDVLFSLDVNRHRYTISGDKSVHSLSSDVDLSLYTAQQERIGRASGSIRFFPDGSSTGGRVVLSKAQKSYKVAVDWLTGRIEIQD
jgi:general secretion pathway protein H